jgi:hypothetical protein
MCGIGDVINSRDRVDIERTEQCGSASRTEKSSGIETYLIRRIADANIKVRQISLDDIPQKHLESFLLRLALHTLRHFGRHTRIEFDSDHFLRLF